MNLVGEECTGVPTRNDFLRTDICLPRRVFLKTRSMARSSAQGVQVAINWCICPGHHPHPRGQDLAEAEENLGALGWRLSGTELRALEGAALAVPKPMLQNVSQTK